MVNFISGQIPGQHGQRLCVLRDHPSKGACDIGILRFHVRHLAPGSTWPAGTLLAAGLWWRSHPRQLDGRALCTALRCAAGDGGKGGTRFGVLSPAQNMLGFVYTGFYSPKNCKCWDCCSPNHPNHPKIAHVYQ